MPDPGDVVVVDFAGATGLKRRPAVVVSSAIYHAHRPDLILATLTSNLASATTPTDHILRDWPAAGLRKPTAFRAYPGMAAPGSIHRIGRLTDRDWEAVQARLAAARGVPAPPIITPGP